MPKIKRQISLGMPNEYNHVHRDDIKEFFLSVRTGNLSKLKKFVEKDRISVNIHDAWDNSPLYLACLCGHAHVVKYLLDNGAHYGGTVDSERCFLSSLTQGIRDILKEYKSTNIRTDCEHEAYSDFLQRLYERVPDFDVQIIVQDQTFLSHRCILAARCRYFHQMFSQEIDTDNIVISDPAFTATSFRALLQYIYTGRLEVYGNEVSETKKLAEFLRYSRLSEVLTIEHRKARQQAGKRIPEGELLVRSYYKEFFKSLQTDFEKLVHNPLRPTGADRNTKDNPQSYFPDICFSVEGVIFECHKMFFYGRSEFFRTLLIDRGDEHPPAYGGYRPTISLDNIQVSDFQDIVGYLYTNKIKLEEGNAEAILILADMLVLPLLKKTSVEKLINYINISNVIQIYQTAKTLVIPKLVNKSINIMANNFLQLAFDSEFQQLCTKELAVLSAGTTFDQIPFFESLQYYIRDDASGNEENIPLANEKLRVLNDILIMDHGINVTLPVLNTNPSTSGRGTRRRSEERQSRRNRGKQSDDCIVL